MTLNAVFRVGGIPCLISDFLATSKGAANVSVPTYPDVEKVLPTGKFNLHGLTRKAAAQRESVPFTRERS